MAVWVLSGWNVTEIWKVIKCLLTYTRYITSDPNYSLILCHILTHYSSIERKLKVESTIEILQKLGVREKSYRQKKQKDWFCSPARVLQVAVSGFGKICEIIIWKVCIAKIDLDWKWAILWILWILWIGDCIKSESLTTFCGKRYVSTDIWYTKLALFTFLWLFSWFVGRDGKFEFLVVFRGTHWLLSLSTRQIRTIMRTLSLIAAYLMSGFRQIDKKRFCRIEFSGFVDFVANVRPCCFFVKTAFVMQANIGIDIEACAKW